MRTGSNLGGEADMPLLNQIPGYDEDLDEAFTGPFTDGLDETYDDEYEAESTAILQGQDPLASASSRRVETDNTQLGAAPGSSMLQQLQQGLPGYRDFEPENPTQANTAEFASSEDEARAGLAEGSHDATNPDGSPLDMETNLLSELQQVQRDIANRRQERMQRQRMVEQQLALARQELQHEVDEDNQWQARMTPMMGDPTSRLLHGQQQILQGDRLA